MKITVETQKARLTEINNQMTLLMKEKKAIQKFIEDEHNRHIGIKAYKDKAYDLREDTDFIKRNGRKRYYWEIGNILGYSERQIRRIFDEDKEIEKNLSK